MSDGGSATFNNYVSICDSSLKLGGTAITSTATELNLLEGFRSIPGACCTGTLDPTGTIGTYDYAKFTAASCLEGRNASEARSDLALGGAAICSTGCCLAINAEAADSQNLDGLDSTQFLRSDAADTASGTVNFTSNICVGGCIIACR